MPEMDKPGDCKKVHMLYEHLIGLSGHHKVWISYAEFCLALSVCFNGKDVVIQMVVDLSQVKPVCHGQVHLKTCIFIRQMPSSMVSTSHRLDLFSWH